jgi:hypothetical protein
VGPTFEVSVCLLSIARHILTRVSSARSIIVDLPNTSIHLLPHYTQISFFQEALEGRRPAYSPASLKSIKIRELEVIPRSLPWVHSFHQPQPAHYSSAAYPTSSIEFSPTFSLSDVLAHAGSYQRGIMNSYHGGVSESSEWTQSLPVGSCYCVVCFCRC